MQLFTFRIISINVRGLGDRVKRRAIFDYYRSRAEIVCLQETHSISDMEQIWRSEWGGRIIFSHGTATARGICILFKKEFFCNILNINCDSEGRYICCEINTDSNEPPITLCSVYAPNQDTPSFINKLSNIMETYSEKKIIIGDFNLVLDNIKDSRGVRKNNNEKTKARLEEMIQEFYLTEIWRCRNPDTTRFSWYRGNQASRIDFAIVSQGLDSQINNCTYLQGLLTDHSAIYLSVEQNKNKRGVGLWRLNSSILQNPENISKVSFELQKLIQCSENMPIINRWDYIKKKIRGKLQQISRESASEEKLAIAQLSEKKNDFEENMPLQQKDQVIYENTKSELDELMLQRARRLIFRSGARWYEEGERNTKYFYNLEKARYNAKTSTKLVLDNGVEVTNDMDILKEQQRFYTDLYAKEEGITYKLENTQNIKISAEASERCGREISMEELTSSVISMKRGKAPGDDGLTVEFYQQLWPQLSVIFLELINNCYSQRKLCTTMKRGVLNLIPKPKKDSRYLKNLRPLTLLNVDYKIIEKTLAKRLDATLDEIINRDQTGFMANRRIAVNIRKVFDLMQHCENEQIEADLINLDYIKCFDRISFESILSSISFFGIPDFIRNWVEILYTDFTIRVQNNGKFTEDIPVCRSVHQGGCISVQLFLLCAESIALELRQCEGIKGIPIDDIIYLLNQYADDMSVASLHEERSIQLIFESLEKCRLSTGFTINYEKTAILRMGPHRDSDAKYYTQKEIAWTGGDIEVLGVIIARDDLHYKNYAPLIVKTTSILEKWAKRNLSLIGKIGIVNTLIASQLVYKMTVLPKIPTVFIKQLESAIHTFLWNGKRAKIPMKILKLSKKDGGANLVDLSKRDSALKITWIQILHNDEKMAHLVYSFVQPTLKEKIWECNLSAKDLPSLMARDRNVFWYDMLYAWCDFNYEADDAKCCDILWYNSLVRIKDQVIWCEKAFERGLLHASQLYDKGQLIGIKSAYDMFNLECMEFNGIVSALPKSWRDRYRKEEKCFSSV